LETDDRLKLGKFFTPGRLPAAVYPLVAPKLRRKIIIDHPTADLPNSSPPPESDNDSICSLPVASDDESSTYSTNEDRLTVGMGRVLVDCYRSSPAPAEEEEWFRYRRRSSSVEEDKVAAVLSC
jgi:hypothetical protein